jgi:hypothetical protein
MDEKQLVTEPDVADFKTEIRRAFHETETRLLEALFQHQEVFNARLDKLSADLSDFNTAFNLRFDNLEQRVVQIEKHIMMP